MQKEIHQQLPSKLKFLLYQKDPDSNINGSILILCILIFNYPFNGFSFIKNISFFNLDNVYNKIEFYILILITINIGIIIYHVLRGVKILKIIENGIVTNAKITKEEIHNSSQSTIETHYLTFTFKDYKHSQHKKVISTSFLVDMYKENKINQIIYDKRKPQKAILLKELPSPVSTYIKKNWI